MVPLQARDESGRQRVAWPGYVRSPPFGERPTLTKIVISMLHVRVKMF
jgi:hypothetical protein